MTSAPLDAWEEEGGSVVEPPEVPEFELAWGLEPAPFRVYETPRCAPDYVRHVSVGFRLSPAMARVDRNALACVRWLLALLAIPLEWAAARRASSCGRVPDNEEVHMIEWFHHGTMRLCITCHAPVLGGPTRCGACAEKGPIGRLLAWVLGRLFDRVVAVEVPEESSTEADLLARVAARQGMLPVEGQRKVSDGELAHLVAEREYERSEGS